MKFSGRLVIPFFIFFLFQISACGKNPEQPKKNTPEAPQVKNPPEKEQDEDKNNNAVVSGFYANDLGFKGADDGRIPPELKNGYRLVNSKCVKCHTVARPLNAQYIEADEAFRAKLLAMNPAALDDPRLLKVESDAWRRMVKRMMAKPGNNILPNDAKEIHAFLAWYYLDKVGANGVAAESWRNHRRKLLEELKNKYPERYKELYENK